MRRTKLVGIAAAAVAMLGGPLAAVPAQAGCVHWTCKTVFETAAFAEGQAVKVYTNALDDADTVWNLVGEEVVDVVCTLWPPQCP